MIETAGLTKRYPGVTALSDVNLAAHAGEIHALVGANGAGKSTLMNVLSGVTRPTAGALRLDGREVSFETPGAAQAAGVATVFQELSLVPQLSVARNLFLGREEVGRFGLVDVAAMERDAAEILSRHALDIDPAATVASLSVARQQMLEIARALTQDARILILDEPTAVLSLTEQNALFEIMRRLSAEGLLILYVSHRLDEVLAIADRVSVMRDGQLVATRPAAGLEMDELVTLMIGRRGAASGRAAPSARPAPRYEIGYETARGREELSIGRGDTWPRRAGGRGSDHLRPCARRRSDSWRKGDGPTGGAAAAPRFPRQAMRAGIVYLTEDRKRDGIFADLDIVENAVASSLDRFARFGLRNPGRERASATRILESLKLVAGRLDMAVARLSGGNQQKVVLARALLTEPELLIVDEPTRGVDVGAKAEIHDLLHTLAARGVTILVISSEIDEVLALAHRVVVMADWRFVASAPATGMDEASILLAASGGSRQGEPT